MSRRNSAFALLCAFAATGCSKFNMVPACSEVASDIAVLFIPESLLPPGGTIDRARVSALVETLASQELAAAYNERTCEANVTMKDGSASARIRFIARQSEGAQRWHAIQFLNTDDPAFTNLVARLQDRYAAS